MIALPAICHDCYVMAQSGPYVTEAGGKRNFLILSLHAKGEAHNSQTLEQTTQDPHRKGRLKLIVSQPQFGDFNPVLWEGRQGMAFEERVSQNKVQAEDRAGKEGKDPELGMIQANALKSNTLSGSHIKGNDSESTICTELTRSYNPSSKPYQVHQQQQAGGLSPSSTSLTAPSSTSPYSYLKDYASFASSASTIMPEKLGSLDTGVLPEKKYNRITRNLRWTILSVYRRLNLLVLIPNLAVIIILGASNSLFDLDPQQTATAVAANLCAAVLMRQELFVNLLFIIFGKCPQSFPLRIRRLAAKIYHLGGVHSGAAIAGTIWFGIYNVSIITLRGEDVGQQIRMVLIVFTAVLDALLFGICISSHPGLRAKYHNWFECTHRFAGWTAVALFWVHVILLTLASRKAAHPMPPAWQFFVKSPPFWLLVTITMSLVFPWLRLRRVPVHAEHLSNHAIRLHFTYANTPLCAAPRFSDNPLKEWHAFAGIPEESGKGFSVLVSKAGDWTTKIIQNPPTKLWTRGMLTRGVLHVAPIFKKLVLVCTGSGVGPIMALTCGSNLNCRILWSTPDPERTFGKDVVSTIYGADPEAIIINTTVSGRQDLLEPTYKLYQQFDAEAVFIISNPRVTRRLVYGLEARGVPTFAPIFDS